MQARMPVRLRIRETTPMPKVMMMALLGPTLASSTPHRGLPKQAAIPAMASMPMISPGW